MGYTHYFDLPAKVDKKDWESAIADIKKIVEGQWLISFVLAGHNERIMYD